MIEQIVFGTRGSPLAIYQTESVIAKLKVLYPYISYKRKIVETDGDRDQDSSLTLMEELGLFYNAIQSELIKKNIDAAVHSLKDIPVEYSEQLILAAIRIDKVHSGEYDAIILAAAGLIRLDHDISKYYIFDFDEITPAPGQGALAVETRRDAKELINMMSQIDNMSIRKAVEVERSILKHIGAGCSVPIGVFASSTDNVFDIVACVCLGAFAVAKMVTRS